MWSCLLLHWVANYFTSSTYVSTQFFATNTPFSFPCFFFHQVFAWSFCSLCLQAMGKQCTNSNSLNGGDLLKGCRGTLGHVQGSPQGRNISFCHTHKAKMPSSQQTRAYRNAMSQSNIKGKRCTNSNSVNGGDLSKGCRGTLGHVQGSPQGRNISFCHTHKAKMPSSQQTRAYCNAMSQSNIKGKRCTTSNSVNGGDLSKGCRGTLGHVQGSPQGHNISFCHTHKAKMPSSQQTRAYRNAMSQSNIKGKQCTNSNSVNGGDLSKGCRGTLGHVQGSPQGCNSLFCHAYKANTPLSQRT